MPVLMNYVKEYSIIVLEIYHLNFQKNLNNITNPHKQVWKLTQVESPVFRITQKSIYIQENTIKLDKTLFIFKPPISDVDYNQLEELETDYIYSLKYNEMASSQIGVITPLNLHIVKTQFINIHNIKYKSAESLLANYGGTVDLFGKVLGFFLDFL